MSKEPFRPQSKDLSIQVHPNLEQQIRERAFELYKQRGGQDGHEMEDWLHAEAEITNATARAAA